MVDFLAQVQRAGSMLAVFFWPRALFGPHYVVDRAKLSCIEDRCPVDDLQLSPAPNTRISLDEDFLSPPPTAAPRVPQHCRLELGLLGCTFGGRRRRATTSTAAAARASPAGAQRTT